MTRNHIDDEYNVDRYTEPRVMITTSRKPSQKLMQFQKEMTLLFPNSVRFNRGAYKLKDIVEAAERKEFSDIILLHEHRGEPDGMIISHMPFGPTLYLGVSGTVMRHDLNSKPDPMSEAYPHLIFENFNSQLGERLKKIFTALFPIPKVDSKRVQTFANYGDLISFRYSQLTRHHTFTKPEYNKVQLNEIGPRFDLKPYQLRLGNLIQLEAKNEWVLRPYMNTATRRDAIKGKEDPQPQTNDRSN